jgi:hypothetical protein
MLMLLAPELFRIHALAGARLEGKEHNILQEVWRSLKDDVQEELVAKAAREQEWVVILAHDGIECMVVLDEV